MGDNGCFAERKDFIEGRWPQGPDAIVPFSYEVRYSDTAGRNLGWCTSAPGAHPKCHASRLAAWRAAVPQDSRLDRLDR